MAYLLGGATEVERQALLGDVHAPSLLDVESTQAIRGLLRGGSIDQARAETAVSELRDLSVHRYVDSPLLHRCWELRDMCTTYDGLYVALAEALDATLVTRDARLARGVGALIDVSAE